MFEAQALLRHTVDIELTNRCNADCTFCPRDATPHEGRMRAEVFEQALHRAVEFRTDMRRSSAAPVDIVFCGMGDALVHSMAPGCVRDARLAGFDVTLSTNGALLTEAKGRALLDAGLQKIHVNAGELDAEYERIYGLSFERTRDNILRFAEMATGRCEVHIVIVDHRRDRSHFQRVKGYWRDRGIENFLPYDLVNRGGALTVEALDDEMSTYGERARALLDTAGVAAPCLAPFLYIFVGYDGRYCLCSSDWRREVPLGSVFDSSVLDVTEQKLRHVLTRKPVCERCAIDPRNRVATRLADLDRGRGSRAAVQRFAEELASGSARGVADLEACLPGVLASAGEPTPSQGVPIRLTAKPAS